jgi:RsiW-degrading membrane proteinase PrsW (M82 family)
MKKNIFNFVIFFIILLSPLIIFGQTEINYPSLPGVTTPQEIVKEIQSGKEAFPLFMNYIFQLLLVVSILVAVGVVSYGGIAYLFSTNNPTKKKNARSWILSAIHGLLIVFVSYAFLFTLDSQLVLFHLRGLTSSKQIEKVNLEWEIENTYFQIPFGLLIEDAILNENAKNKLYDVLDATNAAEAEAEVPALL